MIDWDRIAELQSEIGDAGFVEVVELFLDDLNEAVAALKTTSDPVSYAETLHFLKGSAQNLGLSGVGTLCEREERSLRENERRAPDIGPILAALDVAQRELRGVGTKIGR